MKKLLIVIFGLVIMAGCAPATESGSLDAPNLEATISAAVEATMTARDATATQPSNTGESMETATAVVLHEWTGTGIKNTEPFTITSTPWMVSWDSSGPFFTIYLKRPGQSLFVDVLANQMAGSGDSFVYETGTFYLNINAAGSWNVRVVDSSNRSARDATATQPSNTGESVVGSSNRSARGAEASARAMSGLAVVGLILVTLVGMLALGYIIRVSAVGIPIMGFVVRWAALSFFALIASFCTAVPVAVLVPSIGIGSLLFQSFVIVFFMFWAFVAFLWLFSRGKRKRARQRSE